MTWRSPHAASISGLGGQRQACSYPGLAAKYLVWQEKRPRLEFCAFQGEAGPFSGKAWGPCCWHSCPAAFTRPLWRPRKGGRWDAGTCAEVRTRVAGGTREGDCPCFKQDDRETRKAERLPKVTRFVGGSATTATHVTAASGLGSECRPRPEPGAYAGVGGGGGPPSSLRKVPREAGAAGARAECLCPHAVNFTLKEETGPPWAWAGQNAA